MLVHSSPLFRIYFGTANDQLWSMLDKNTSDPVRLSVRNQEVQRRAFAALKKKMRLNYLFFPHQVHGDNGIVITQANIRSFSSFSYESDYVLTQEKSLGIGILTADCLPIVLYDSVNRAVAVVHAGWKSSARRIAAQALQQMKSAFGTHPEAVQVFFGPSARSCCYVVKDDFLKHFEDCTYLDVVAYHHAGRVSFDLPLFNKIQLESCGVLKDAFHTQYNQCTICDQRFCSNRRDGLNAGRQMTVVCLW